MESSEKIHTNSDVLNDVLRGKWFAPILDDLEKLESLMCGAFAEFEPALADDSPPWMFQCLLRGAQPFKSFPISVRLDRFSSREVGMMIGAKWAIISAIARFHPFWKMFNADQVAKIEAVLGVGSVEEAFAYSGEVKEQHLPVIREIKQRAMQLAEEAGLQEEIDYMQGCAAGGKILEEIRRKMRRPQTKRETDEQKRQLVYLFGALFGREVEIVKADVSWCEIADAVGVMAENKVVCDEDTVKKILHRVGLKGVGKAGRPLGK
jgi:hypothetical protein